jgi:hypothetical protein
MIRYRLDDLGWFQFEWLVQSLLKADLGLGVESWGGSADRGRDAYCRTPLRFPARDIESEGPFLFQVKFAEQANAAGADWEPAVIRAVRAEAARIAQRIKFKTWGSPRHYSLITNAPLTPTIREAVETIIVAVVGAECAVHTFGGSDVCDLLDSHPAVRRSFPQLLGLRDLNELLAAAVHADVITKSPRSTVPRAGHFRSTPAPGGRRACRQKASLSCTRTAPT